MEKLRVGVVRGGPSSEYDVSLQTGASVLKHLPPHYKGVDLLLDKEGLWHCQGVPTTPAKLTHQVDVVFNALHGAYGEDGQIQLVLDQIGLPYTGSGQMGSALGMNKGLAKERFAAAGLKTPRHVVVGKNVDPAAAAALVFSKMAPPWVVKPADGGSSIGVSIAKTLPGLIGAIEQCFTYSNQVMIEEYVKGREATVGVVEGLRGQNHYPLFPIEIRVPATKTFFDYEAKYTGVTEEICPGLFSATEKAELNRLAVAAHQILNLRHYSRADFIVTKRGIYILEVNTLPGLTENSLLPKALAAGGVTLPSFLDHVIQLALKQF